MNIKLSPFARSFAFNGTAYLSEVHYYNLETDVTRQAKIAHEYAHLNQQPKGFFRCVLWVIRYFMFKKFRRDAESVAFMHEWKVLIDNKRFSNNIQQGYEYSIPKNFWGAFTDVQVEDLIMSANRLYKNR